MDTNLFHSAFLASLFHRIVDIGFGKREDLMFWVLFGVLGGYSNLQKNTQNQIIFAYLEKSIVLYYNKQKGGK